MALHYTTLHCECLHSLHNRRFLIRACLALRAKCRVRLAWLVKRPLRRLVPIVKDLKVWVHFMHRKQLTIKMVTGLGSSILFSAMMPWMAGIGLVFSFGIFFPVFMAFFHEDRERTPCIKRRPMPLMLPLPTWRTRVIPTRIYYKFFLLEWRLT